jgi:predicted aspartyl protease
MATGNKKFKIKFINGLPFMEVDLFIGSPLPQTNPKTKKVAALFDTGADFTLIPIDLVDQLKLVWTGRTNDIETYNEEIVTVKFYSVRIKIDSILEEIIEIGAAKYQPIIGMDLILKLKTLINGPEKLFEIETPQN